MNASKAPALSRESQTPLGIQNLALRDMFYIGAIVDGPSQFGRVAVRRGAKHQRVVIVTAGPKSDVIDNRTIRHFLFDYPRELEHLNLLSVLSDRRSDSRIIAHKGKGVKYNFSYGKAVMNQIGSNVYNSQIKRGPRPRHFPALS
jgi:hypothetical protein